MQRTDGTNPSNGTTDDETAGLRGSSTSYFVAAHTSTRQHVATNGLAINSSNFWGRSPVLEKRKRPPDRQYFECRC